MKPLQKITSVLFITIGSLQLTACGGFNVWPFGDSKVETNPYKPADAVEYACDANKKFYVKKIENGNAVWLILPDREFALAKIGDAANASRYSNKISTLEVNGTDATLEISSTNTFKGCKLVSSKP